MHLTFGTWGDSPRRPVPLSPAIAGGTPGWGECVDEGTGSERAPAAVTVLRGDRTGRVVWWVAATAPGMSDRLDMMRELGRSTLPMRRGGASGGAE